MVAFRDGEMDGRVPVVRSKTTALTVEEWDWI